MNKPSPHAVVAGLTLLLLAAASPALAADTYSIDASHSSILFTVNHLGISNYTGRFNDVSGTVNVDDRSFAKSSVKLAIDVQTVDTNNKKRDDHLRGPDFFNAKQFPEITFESTSVSGKAESFQVTGKLTLRGVTKTVTMDVKRIGEGKDPWGGHRAGWEAAVTIKRSDFGMKYMIPGLGDEIDLLLQIEGIRK